MSPVTQSQILLFFNVKHQNCCQTKPKGTNRAIKGHGDKRWRRKPIVLTVIKRPRR